MTDTLPNEDDLHPTPRPARPRGYLTEDARARISRSYIDVYSACAGYGVREETCRRYARDAVADLSALLHEIQENLN